MEARIVIVMVVLAGSVIGMVATGVYIVWRWGRERRFLVGLLRRP